MSWVGVRKELGGLSLAGLGRSAPTPAIKAGVFVCKRDYSNKSELEAGNDFEICRVGACERCRNFHSEQSLGIKLFGDSFGGIVRDV